MLHNLLEPAGLIRHFHEHPPEGFLALDLAGGTPAFAAPFDLLTTLEPPLRRALDTLPFSRTWRRLLWANTCFIGTTVSEFALLPSSTPPEVIVPDLVTNVAPLYPFLIVKDLPTEATLVGDAALAWSRRLVNACMESGFVLMEGQALAYVPIDFSSIDEFIARQSHARRKNLRRKLRGRSRLTIETIQTGDARFLDEGFLGRLYELYQNVYRQSEVHFDLLTADFFRAVLQDSSAEGVVFAYRANDELIGYNLCFCHDGMLVDKYVGFAYPQARQFDLYAVSWFHNIEYALAKGLGFYIAGWTDPDAKRNLCASFTLTQHAVYVRAPLLRALLKSFKRLFESDHQWQQTHASRTHP